MRYIMNEMANLRNSLYSLNTNIQQVREELSRLEETLSQLLEDQGKLNEGKEDWLHPELSQATWHGQRSKLFQSFRENDLQKSYQNISESQLNQTIDELKSEIQMKQKTIASLQGTISAQNSRLGDLHEQQRKELAK